MTDVTEPTEAAVLLAVADAVTALRNEETRRALMHAHKNVQKDAPFNIGDTVFDYSLRSVINPSGAVAVVIGLPLKKATQATRRRRHATSYGSATRWQAECQPL